MRVYVKTNNGCGERLVEHMTITELTDTRVKGTVQWDNEKGISDFDVKRLSDNKFSKGSGSGKTTYHFKLSGA